METQIPEAFFILFVLCLIMQVYVLVFRHARLVSYHPVTEMPVVDIPVSVIISARNEIVNLGNNLPLIMAQNYPTFEVVLVNDRSYDGTHELLEELAGKYERLKIVTVIDNERFVTGKKFALTMGIKAAKYEHLLFTDADCRPASENWISLMAANFTESIELVLGYSPYLRKPGLLNAFIRFETVRTAINYLSAAVAERAYMGVGRNLAYTKSLFFKVKGFASHMHVMTGDDDLFVNQNTKPGNTIIEIHPDAFTFSEAKTSWSAFFRQKKRHMGAGKLYKAKHKRMLAMDAISGLLLYITFILCLVFNFETLVIAGLFISRWITQIFVYRNVFKKLDNKDLIWALPFFDLLYYLYLNVFGLIGSFFKTTRWK